MSDDKKGWYLGKRFGRKPPPTSAHQMKGPEPGDIDPKPKERIEANEAWYPGKRLGYKKQNTSESSNPDINSTENALTCNNDSSSQSQNECMIEENPIGEVILLIKDLKYSAAVLPRLCIEVAGRIKICDKFTVTTFDEERIVLPFNDICDEVIVTLQEGHLKHSGTDYDTIGRMVLPVVEFLSIGKPLPPRQDRRMFFPMPTKEYHHPDHRLFESGLEEFMGSGHTKTLYAVGFILLSVEVSLPSHKSLFPLYFLPRVQPGPAYAISSSSSFCPSSSHSVSPYSSMSASGSTLVEFAATRDCRRLYRLLQAPPLLAPFLSFPEVLVAVPLGVFLIYAVAPRQLLVLATLTIFINGVLVKGKRKFDHVIVWSFIRGAALASSLPTGASSSPSILSGSSTGVGSGGGSSTAGGHGLAAAHSISGRGHNHTHHHSANDEYDDVVQAIVAASAATHGSLHGTTSSTGGAAGTVAGGGGGSGSVGDGGRGGDEGQGGLLTSQEMRNRTYDWVLSIGTAAEVISNLLSFADPRMSVIVYAALFAFSISTALIMRITSPRFLLSLVSTVTLLVGTFYDSLLAAYDEMESVVQAYEDDQRAEKWRMRQREHDEQFKAKVAAAGVAGGGVAATAAGSAAAAAAALYHSVQSPECGSTSPRVNSDDILFRNKEGGMDSASPDSSPDLRTDSASLHTDKHASSTSVSDKTADFGMPTAVSVNSAAVAAVADILTGTAVAATTSSDIAAALTGSGGSASIERSDGTSTSRVACSPRVLQIVRFVRALQAFWSRAPNDIVLVHRHIASLSAVKEDGPEMLDAADAKKQA